MAVGQPTRQRYQRPLQPHQTIPGDFYLTGPPAAIPTGNVHILVPRQASEDTSLTNTGTDGVPGSSLPSGPPNSAPPPPTTGQPPPSTTTSEPPPTDTLTLEPHSTTTSTTTHESASSSKESPSRSPTPSITPTPSQSSERPSSTSLTFSPETTITSPVVLTIDGRRTTSYVSIPTTLSDPGSRISSSERTAIIAGSVGGGIVLIILIAAIILFYRRHQNKKRGFFPSSEPKPRTMLLSGEDLEDDYGYSRQTSSPPTPLPSSIRRTDSPVNTVLRSGSTNQSPRLLRPRASDTGSIFHEEGIWPPPSDGSRLVDPILAGSHINLSNIVDNVMGNSIGHQDITSGSNAASRPRGGRRSLSGDTSTIYTESIYSTDLPAFVHNPGHDHTRENSSNSETGLIPPEPLYLASTHNSGSSPSILPPRYEAGFDPSRSSTSISNPNSTRNWLDRSPRKMTESPSNPFNRTPSPFAPDNGRYS